MLESTNLSLPNDHRGLPNWPCIVYNRGARPFHFGKTHAMVKRSTKLHKCLSPLLLTNKDFLINVHANGVFMIDVIIKKMGSHEAVTLAYRLLKSDRMLHSVSIVSSTWVEPWHKIQIIKEIKYSILERNHLYERIGYTQQLEDSC